MGTLSGLSKTETMLSAPGEVFDLFELHLRVNGVKKEKSSDE